ncbi:LysR family transcriptional regulator [Variovorax sp. HJSM1_2]|uniref:LysR family transcriptional regulator n=1 Tax=Variovorax sp. HJSM1_2 TaxID=3366263 RepID=UPI003BE85BBE
MSKTKTSADGSNATDRIELMRTFVRIVEAGSLSAVASQLGATQPTVSRRLQALERSLGLRLLHRSTHAMKLTEDGQRCYTRAKEMLANWDVFEAELRGAGDEPEGLLRVVAPHAFGQALLIAPLADYLRRYPRVTADWRLHDRAPDFIAEGIDCAIQVGEVSDPGLVAIRLAQVPRIVVAAPSVLARQALPRHAQELASLPWLALSTYYRNEVELRHEDNAERIARVPIQPLLSTDSLFALRSAALLGLGACIASAWAVADDVAQGRLLHLAPAWQAAPLPVSLVYPYAPHYPAKLRRFVEHVRQTTPAAMGAVLQPAAPHTSL